MLNKYVEERRAKQVRLMEAAGASLAEQQGYMTREARLKEDQRAEDMRSRVAIGNYAKQRKQRLFEDTENYTIRIFTEVCIMVISEITKKALLVDIDKLPNGSFRVAPVVRSVFSALQSGDVSYPDFLIAIGKYIPEYTVGSTIEPSSLMVEIYDKILSEFATEINETAERAQNIVAEEFRKSVAYCKDFKGKVSDILNTEDIKANPVLKSTKLFSLSKNEALGTGETFDSKTAIGLATLDYTAMVSTCIATNVDCDAINI